MDTRHHGRLCAIWALCALLPPAHAGLVINEIQTAGLESAADEFVEIVNTSAAAVSLSGFRLVYRSAASQTDTVLVRFADGDSVAPGGVIVLGGSAYTGPRDGGFSGSLASAGGGVALRNADGDFVDRVAWGTASNGFAETRATLAPAAGHSIHRLPCGYDSDNNARDLQELVNPTPRVQCDGVSAPAVLTAAFTPPGVKPGEVSTLTATVAVGTRPLASVTADLASLGGSTAVPLAFAGGAWSVAVAVPEGVEPGPVPVRVRAEDAAGASGSGIASLYVRNPVPAAVVIHEIQVGGSSADVEFVELYNRTDGDVDLTGCVLAYRAPTSAEESVLHAFAANTKVKPGGFYLLGTDAFRGPKDATVRSGLGANGGGLGLRNAAGALMDSVGYGTAENLFVETRAAPAPPAGHSIERSPRGRDTNDNKDDFVVRTDPTPTPAVNKPVVSTVTFEPASIPAGGTGRITALVTSGDAEITEVIADLIFVGGETNHPLQHTLGYYWSAEFTVASRITVGPKPVMVYARDASGMQASWTGALTVIDGRLAAPVKVNEIQTGTLVSAAEEFVELYNPSSAPADLSGWTLVYRSEKGTTDSVLARFTHEIIAPEGYFLLASSAYGGPKNGPLLGPLAASAGSVGLRDSTGALVDSVGYGAAANALVETSPAPAPDPGRSIGRKTPGQDTNNNAADFRVENPPSPRAGLAIVPGDANGDGVISLSDAAFALAIAGGLAPATAAAADVFPASPDGRITVEDALAIAHVALAGG